MNFRKSNVFRTKRLDNILIVTHLVHFFFDLLIKVSLNVDSVQLMISLWIDYNKYNRVDISRPYRRQYLFLHTSIISCVLVLSLN